MTQPGHASTIGTSQNRPDDARILDRCHRLGLTLLQAIQLANADNPSDPKALLRVLRLDFSTYEPLVSYRKHEALQMAAMSSSVSYRGTLTREGLLAILTSGLVPAEFVAHIGHFLDEVSASVVLFSVVEAAQESGMPIHQVWSNVAKLAVSHSDYRQPLWALIAGVDTSFSC
jgi:hypothetical protein